MGTTQLTLLTLNIRGCRNKQQHIITLAKKHKSDFIFLQETNINTEHEAQTYTRSLGMRNSHFSLGQHCRGVGIIQTSDRWEITHRDRDNEGRRVTINITDKRVTYTLVNIYAPTQNSEKTLFYNTLAQTLRYSHNRGKLILGGDFNYITNKLDTTNINRKDTIILEETTGIEIIQYITETYNIIDAYRKITNGGKETTFTSNMFNIRSRLDRFYTPTIDTINTVKHISETLGFTDHKGVKITLNSSISNIITKSPHWKFNNTLLENKQYTDIINNIIQQYSTLPTTNIGQHWELLKSTIKHVTQNIATQLHRQRKQREKQLETTIQTEKTNNTPRHTIQELEDELETIKQHTYNGAQVRSRIGTNTTEAPTKQFLTIEQNIQKSRQIVQIIDTEGKTQTDTQEIVDTFEKYYTHLFEKEQTDPDIQDKYSQFTQTLQEHQTHAMDKTITLADIKTALSGMNTNKTPGPDGLTTEFYTYFFTTLGPILHATLEEAYIHNKLPDSMNTSYITLLPKKDTDRTQLKNHRPISLLNTDYKILTKTLANKLKPHLNTLIHTNQQCNIKGRNIQNHNHFIRDLIQYTNDKNIQTCILSLDQEKAFDRVDHTYLHTILQHNKLGDYFCNWVRILYRTPISNLIINNTLSKNININRSVRQGCPLSPYLYILAFEPLLEKIRREEKIKGVGIPGGKEIKVTAYADDTVFFPIDDRSINEIISIFQEFGRGSGSKINISKSEIMGIGKWKDRLDFPLGIARKTSLRIYGIYFSNNQKHTNTETWQNIEHSIKNKIDRHRYTAHTIFGRSTIINTYIIPKTIYTGVIWDPPHTILTQINTHIREYIFQGTIHNIKHTTLIQNKLEGGINLQDIQTKIQALRIRFIGNAIRNKTENTFTHYYIGIRLGHLTKIDNSTPHYTGKKNLIFTHHAYKY